MVFRHHSVVWVSSQAKEILGVSPLTPDDNHTLHLPSMEDKVSTWCSKIRHFWLAKRKIWTAIYAYHHFEDPWIVYRSFPYTSQLQNPHMVHHDYAPSKMWHLLKHCYSNYPQVLAVRLQSVPISFWKGSNWRVWKMSTPHASQSRIDLFPLIFKLSGTSMWLLVKFKF